MVDLCLIIENDQGRAALIDRMTRELGEALCLVKITDAIGMIRQVKTTPNCPNAVLIARESPLLVRGGITYLTFYYAVPVDQIDATEVHFYQEKETHRYDPIPMKVACLGRQTRRMPNT